MQIQLSDGYAVLCRHSTSSQGPPTLGGLPPTKAEAQVGKAAGLCLGRGHSYLAWYGVYKSDDDDSLRVKQASVFSALDTFLELRRHLHCCVQILERLSVCGNITLLLTLTQH